MNIKKLNEKLELLLENGYKEPKPLDTLNSTKYPIKWTARFYDDLYTEKEIKDILKKAEEMVDILKHVNNTNNKEKRNLSYVPINPVKYGKDHTNYWGRDEVGNIVSTREDKQAIYGVGLDVHYSQHNWIFLDLYKTYTDKPNYEVYESIGTMIGYGTENSLVSYDQFIEIYKKFKSSYKKYYDVNYDALSNIDNPEIYF